MHFKKTQEHVQRHMDTIEDVIFGKCWVVKSDHVAGYGHSGRSDPKVAGTTH